MRCFDTADRATSRNLEYLDCFTRIGPRLSASELLSREASVVEVINMLPSAVRSHFELPYLGWISDSSPELVDQRSSKFSRALEAGLEAAMSDNTLRKGGGADMSDRPATKAEEIEAALKEYEFSRGRRELQKLQQAVAGTQLSRRVDRLEYWLGRKRPSPGGRPIANEIASVLWDVRHHACDYHHMPASYGFRRGAALNHDGIQGSVK